MSEGGKKLSAELLMLVSQKTSGGQTSYNFRRERSGLHVTLIFHAKMGGFLGATGFPSLEELSAALDIIRKLREEKERR